MSATMNRTSSVQTKWECTFPSDVTTEKNSSQFVHRLVKIGSALILDKRGLFEDGDKVFKSRTIDKLLISSFNEKGNAKAKQIADKISALKDAIDEKYLREFAIVFYKKPDEEDILEVFSFRFLYGTGNNEVTVSLNTGLGSEEFNKSILEATFTDMDSTKRTFVSTMKKVHRFTKNLENLPSEADASLRISFTENTPKDFIVEGFEASPIFYEISKDVLRREAGIISGGHHNLQLLAASTLWKTTVDLNTTNASMNQSLMAKTPAKIKPTEEMQKRRSSRKEKCSPYGHTASLNKKNTDSSLLV